MNDTFSKNFSMFKYLIIITLSLFLGWLMRESLSWRMQHDSPILLYIAFLIGKFNYVPYRDIFDMNLPGTYFIYYLIGTLSDYNDYGFRIADLLLLVGIITSTWFWLRRLNYLIAIYAPVIFSLVYLSLGPRFSLQREYLIIMLLSLTLALTVSSKAKHNLSFLANGFLCGFSIVIKPHSLIFYIPVFLYQLMASHSGETRAKLLSRIILYFAGLSAPLIIIVIYLLRNNALTSFLDGLNYLSLYGKLTGTHRTISGVDRLEYLLKNFIAMGGFKFNAYWLIPSFFGLLLSWYYGEFEKEQKKLVYLILTLTACAAIYPVFSGQFWVYHYLVFLYVMTILSSFAVLPFLNAKVLYRTAVFVVFIAVLSSQIYSIYNEIDNYKASPQNGFIDSLAAGIQKNVKGDQTIQPLDWTAGAIHAMLIARKPIATPFIYDFHFYHHVSHPYIQNLRKKFIKAMEEKKPTYIVKIDFKYQPTVSGKDTTQKFPELDEMIKNQYFSAVTAGEIGVIYKRR